MGILHFLVPKQFEEAIPKQLPARRALVYASGVTELATGLGSLHPKTRRWAGYLGIATMVGVFPANVQMSLEPEKYPVPPAALHARLPFQLLFVYWLYKRCLRNA
jgi:uncharacterized membrane protein